MGDSAARGAEREMIVGKAHRAALFSASAALALQSRVGVRDYATGAAVSG